MRFLGTRYTVVEKFEQIIGALVDMKLLTCSQRTTSNASELSVVGIPALIVEMRNAGSAFCIPDRRAVSSGFALLMSCGPSFHNIRLAAFNLDRLLKLGMNFVEWDISLGIESCP